MGKGDRKTAKGKRYNSSYGNVRSHAADSARSTAAESKMGSGSARKAVVKKSHG